ncbi:SH3 domain-containing protein [Streptococcus macacae]|uniref:GBS Bsp-like repeat protein n=1 Tax=Streptococcus macacae NCTC 11558 TaxID=764298 RepID=G5JVU3_9STRE|nr:SH3 domain-containing protein [Streptococcus macacae]EHJ53353.1 GBS Bsp-like repeat protein [Streptococcus macacae NCTC 11558]SUN78934.1 putative 40 kDa cell wall protein precursor [Streptococcus macacae NCTC 11558]
MKKNFYNHQEQRFSIRKYTFGAASVLIGCVLFLGVQNAAADDQLAQVSSEGNISVQPTEQKNAESPTDQKTKEGSAVTIDSAAQSAVVKEENMSNNALKPASSETLTAKTAAEYAEAKTSHNVAKNPTKEKTNLALADVKEASNTAKDKTVKTAQNVQLQAKKAQVQLKKQTVQKSPAQPSLAPRGNYVFKKRTAVKNEPKESSPNQFFFDAGQKVYYDKLLENDGYQWLSYISYSGVRRYAPIFATKTTSAAANKEIKNSLSSQGTYHFTKQTDVKNEPKVSSPTQFSFYKGDQVYYDKVLNADNHQWLSYISYSGIRRYVLIGESAAPAKPSAIKVSGKITIQNKSSQQFDVVISEVSSNQGLRTVLVPVWSEENGQDDLIWYRANKQKDNHYKVTVKIKDHKNSTGQYNIHLYYLLGNGQQVGVGARSTTVEAPKKDNRARLNLPARGSYTFTKEVSVKNEPKMSSATQFTFKSGERINYDKVLENDGYQWISYISYSGIRRYIPLLSASAPKPRKQSQSLSPTINLPLQGTYRFTKRVGVKNEAKAGSPDLFSFNKGDSVYYDKVLKTDGHQWISYISYSGIRRYIIIA